jgi:hypothetical protein
MSFVGRVSVAVIATLGVAGAGIVYYRAGLPIIDMAQNQFSGPYTPVATALTNVVPVVLTVILLAVWTWVLYGAVQKERRRRVMGR